MSVRTATTGWTSTAISGGSDRAFRAYWVKDDTVVAALHVNDWDASDAIRESIGTTR